MAPRASDGPATSCRRARPRASSAPGAPSPPGIGGIRPHSVDGKRRALCGQAPRRSGAPTYQRRPRPDPSGESAKVSRHRLNAMCSTAALNRRRGPRVLLPLPVDPIPSSSQLPRSVYHRTRASRCRNRRSLQRNPSVGWSCSGAQPWLLRFLFRSHPPRPKATRPSPPNQGPAETHSVACLHCPTYPLWSTRSPRGPSMICGH